MPDVVIRLKATKEGFEAFDEAGNKLRDFGRESDSSGLGLLNLNAAVGLVNTGLGALKSGLQVTEQMNQLGREARSADASLSALSSGHADQYLRAMDNATGGLVDRMTEAKDASFLLSHGIASSSEEIAKITHLGAVLGETFMNTATGGIDAVDNALEHVGNKRALYQLSVDVPAVEARFKELKKTLGDEKAWTQAVEEGLGKAVAKVGDNFDKPGAALDKLNAKLETLKQTASKPISVVVDFLAGKVLDSNLMKLIAARERDDAAMAPIFQDLASGKDGGLSVNGAPVGSSGWQSVAANIAGSQDRQGPMPSGAALGSANPLAGSAMTPDAIEQATAIGAAAARRHKQDLAEINGESVRYISTLQGVNANWRDAVGLSSQVQANIRQMADDAKNASITRAAIGAEVSGFSGGLASDAQGARQRLVRGGASKADLAAFDASTQAAMDSYALSTGSATKESLAFRDIHESLSKSVANGTMSITQEANVLAQLSNAAKEGTLSMSQLNREQAILAGTDDHLQISRGTGDREIAGAHGAARAGLRLAQLEGDFATGTKTNAKSFANDFSNVVLSDQAKLAAAFDPLITSSNNASKAAGNINTTVNTIPGAMGAAAIRGAAALAPLIAALALANNLAANLGGRGVGKP